MTAEEIVSHPLAIAEPQVQCDRARRSHEREALLAHVANRHDVWQVQREAQARLGTYGRTELHPSSTDPEGEVR